MVSEANATTPSGTFISRHPRNWTSATRIASFLRWQAKAISLSEVKKGLRSRPIIIDLFESDPENTFSHFHQLLSGERHSLGAGEITRCFCSVAIACCSAIDVLSASDRKTQGTIFEWLCAAAIQSALNVEPRRSLPVLNLDLQGNLPTDFIFDLGQEKLKFHLPVKTSTRERIIQVRAHQGVLDGVCGAGRFLAMPLILTETKLDSKKFGCHGNLPPMAVEALSDAYRAFVERLLFGCPLRLFRFG